ncbi:MAG: hypothetical protein MZV49_24400 [Rhodopseudomonas palustris]|nr:hypothetical protein [Rhodopseudomonas palustris]
MTCPLAPLAPRWAPARSAARPADPRVRPPAGAPLARRGLLYAVLIAGGLLMMVPFFWMIVTSLKTRAEVFGAPPLSLPSGLAFRELHEHVERVPERGHVRDVLRELAQDRPRCAPWASS